MYKPLDEISKKAIDCLKIRPMRYSELLRKVEGLSIHRLNTLELQGVLFAERSVEHKQTMYYLLPSKKEKETDALTSAKDSCQQVKY